MGGRLGRWVRDAGYPDEKIILSILGRRRIFSSRWGGLANWMVGTIAWADEMRLLPHAIHLCEELCARTVLESGVQPHQASRQGCYVQATGRDVGQEGSRTDARDDESDTNAPPRSTRRGSTVIRS